MLALVELNLVSETDKGNQDGNQDSNQDGNQDMAELVSDVNPKVDLKIKSEPTEKSTVDFTDVEADASPPSKRARLGDMEKIIMGKELTDIEINLAQQLLKSQFPKVNGLQSTLLQDKQTMLTERSVHSNYSL